MTTLTAIGFSIYIIARGGEMPGAVGLIQLAGVILLSNITGTAILCFIVSLIKSMSVWGTVGTIIGTLSGFLMGVYGKIRSTKKNPLRDWKGFNLFGKGRTFLGNVGIMHKGTFVWLSSIVHMYAKSVLCKRKGFRDYHLEALFIGFLRQFWLAALVSKSAFS